MNLPVGSEVVPLMIVFSFCRDKAMVAYSMGCRSTESRMTPSIFPKERLADGWAFIRNAGRSRKLRRNIFFKTGSVSELIFGGFSEGTKVRKKETIQEECL